MKNIIYSEMKPTEQKILIQGIGHVFFGLDSEFL